MDSLHFDGNHELTAMVEHIAKRRGISFNDAAQLMSCSDLERNTKNNPLPLSDDVARFRLGESES